MGKVVGGMTLSLDGFVCDLHGDVSRLYPDLGELRKTATLEEEIRTTSAVVMGRHSYNMGEPDSVCRQLRISSANICANASYSSQKAERERNAVDYFCGGWG